MELIQELNNNIVNVESLNQLSKNFKIKYKYENTMDKLLFYTQNNSSTHTNISYYSNGIICEYFENEWHIVCFPLPNLSSPKFFDKKTEYIAYPIYEGTVVNVYFSKLKNKWCYGTKKSFDLSEKTWRGVNYSDIFQCINTDTFDKKNTYVFCVTDRRLHLFTANFMQEQTTCVKLGECNPAEIECIGEIEIDINIIPDLCKNALIEYLNTGEALLGFILRSVNSSIIFESSLMKKINNMIYKPRFIKGKNEREREINNNNNMNYVIARNYINDYKYSEKMFPDFIAKFKIIKNTESALIDYLIKKYEIRSVPLKTNKNLKTFEIVELFEGFIDKHRMKLHTLLHKNTKLRNIIQDFIFKDKDIDFIASLI